MRSERLSPSVISIRLTPAKLTLYGTGKLSAQTVTVKEQGYVGKITITSTTCAKVAKTSLASGNAPKFRVSVTGVGIGSCTLTFEDSAKRKALLPIVDKAGGSVITSLLVPLKIPRDKHHGYRPHFISPSTQAMTFDVAGPTNVNIVSGLTALSPGCQLTINGLVCTFGTTLAPCPTSANCYTATITTYDAYTGPATNTIPPYAAPLSISVTPFNIAANATNAITFNFSGIPARIAMVPGSAFTTQLGNQFDLVGQGTHPMFAEAIDADNNVIAGIGGPTYALSGAGRLGFYGVPPAPGSPRFSLIPLTNLDLNDTATLTITASYPSGTDGCAVQGAVCTGQFTIGMQSLMAVASQTGTTLYAAEKGVGPLATITTGYNNPIAVAFDAQGNLYTASYASGQQVDEYPVGTTLATRSITAGLSNPIKLGFDGSNNLYVLNGGPIGQSNYGPASVSEYAPGATTPLKTTPVTASPTLLAVDSAGDFWVSSYLNKSIVYYPHDGSAAVTLAGPSGPLVQPVGMTVGANLLYVSDGTFTPSNQSSPVCGGTEPAQSTQFYCPIYTYAPGASSPTSTFYSTSYGGYGGNLFYAAPVTGHFNGLLFQDESYGVSFAAYTLGSTGSQYAAFTDGLQGGNGSQQIAADQLGNLFIAQQQNSAVYGIHNASLQGSNVRDYVQITNGINNPTSLAIIP